MNLPAVDKLLIESGIRKLTNHWGLDLELLISDDIRDELLGRFGREVSVSALKKSDS